KRPGAHRDRRTGIAGLGAVGQIGSGQGLRAGGRERDAESLGAGNQRHVRRQAGVGVTGRNAHRVGDGIHHVPEIVHRVDGDVEGGAGGTRGGRAGLARGRARRGDFARYQQLEFREGRRADDDVAGGRAAQAAGGEVEVHGRGEVVGQIRKRGDAVDGGGGQGPLQGAAAGAAGRRDHGAVVAGAQVAKGVQDPNRRRRRKGNARAYCGGRLCLYGQTGGGTRVHGEDSARGAAQAGGAGGQLLARAGGVNPQIGERGGAVAGCRTDVKGRRSLQWTGSAGQAQVQIQARRQARRRGIAELVLGAD